MKKSKEPTNRDKYQKLLADMVSDVMFEAWKRAKKRKEPTTLIAEQLTEDIMEATVSCKEDECMPVGDCCVCNEPLDRRDMGNCENCGLAFHWNRCGGWGDWDKIDQYECNFLINRRCRNCKNKSEGK